jgi:hypothetical protein
MDLSTSTPGVTVTVEDQAVLIRVERDFALPMLSILLHSKFSDGPRLEFLTNPHTNKMIDALMAAASLTEYMEQREGMAQALASVIQFVEELGRKQKLSAEEATVLMRSAIYPYRAT